MANAVTLTFAGDSASLDKTFTSVNKGLTGISSNSARADQSFTDSAGKITKTSKGVKDSLEGITGALATVGISFPGEQAIQFASIAMDMSKGVKDLAEGLGGALSSGLSKVKGLLGMQTAATEAQTAATEEGTVAQGELDAALDANPIGAIILVVAALSLGFYELWEHCTTFRDIVKVTFTDTLNVIKTCWNWVKSNWPLLLAILTGPIGIAVLEITKHWNSIKSGASTLVGWFKSGWSALTSVISAPFTAAFDLIKSAWNSTVGGFGIPSINLGLFHTPGFTIPKMANGGRPTGPTLVGERGPEMFMPDGPGTIVPMRGGQTGASGVTHVTVDFSGVSTDALINALRQGVKIRGGNVQTTLGVGY